MNKPDLIYIYGSGRSGTTLITNLLNYYGNFIGVGELNKGFRDFKRECSCGQTILNCELWSNVIAQIEKNSNFSKENFYRILSNGVLEVVGELERMGDYAKGIAKIALLMGDEPPVKPLIDIPRMVELAVSMLHRAVGAFVEQDAELARSIPQEDHKVDALYQQVYRELVTMMFANPEIIDRANYLMWAAHNLERVADRVTNICERTIYVVTGHLEELSTSDDEIQLDQEDEGI